MLVGEKMTKRPVTVRPDDTLEAARKRMDAGKFRRIPVLEGDKLVGIVSDRDLRQHIGMLEKTKVNAVMTQKVITVTSSTMIERAARLLVRHRVGGLPVVDDGKLVGMITSADMLKVLVGLVGAEEEHLARIDLVRDSQTDRSLTIAQIDAAELVKPRMIREGRNAEPGQAHERSAAFSHPQDACRREVEVEVLAEDPSGTLGVGEARAAAVANTASRLFKATGHEALAILAGLALLSGSMFVFGTVAGYELGLRHADNERSAAVLPATAASLAGSSPPTSMALDSGGTVVMPPGSTSPPKTVAIASLASAPPRTRRAARAKAAKARTARSASLNAAQSVPENAALSSSSHRKGYSIQIEAVTDKSGADAMVAKLRHLGYQGYTVATVFGSETWYKVRVGPFVTEDEAHWAEAKLHDKYSLLASGAASRTTVTTDARL